MMQCLPARCRLLSPVPTYLAQRRCDGTRIFLTRRATGPVVRAESASTSTSTTSPASAEVALSPPAPASKSIITEENIINAIAGDNILLEDHYGMLRVNPDSSTTEIFQAYRRRRAEVQEQSLEDAESRELLNKLQDSVDLLTSEEERRMYDWSLLRKATHTVDYAWPYEADRTQRLEDRTPVTVQANEDEGNRKVAYFFAGWFALSCILTIVVGMK